MQKRGNRGKITDCQLHHAREFSVYGIKLLAVSLQEFILREIPMD